MASVEELQLQGEIDQFNKLCPVGTRVSVMKDLGECVETTVKHEATILGGHTAVAWLDGFSACYMLSRVRKI